MDKKGFQSPLESFYFAIYEPKYFEETLELLTRSYVSTSPLVKDLGLTEEHMRKEFKHQLETGYYAHGVLAIYKETGEIAGTIFWDLLEKFEWFEVDLLKVPTIGHVRQYMRQAGQYKFIQTLDRTKEQYVYSGNVAVKPKFMGNGLGNVLMYFLALDLEYYGYRFILGCAINKAAQSMYEKPWSKNVGEIDCSIITTLQGEKPFAGSKINYKSYILGRDDGQPWLEKKLGGKGVHPLRKSKL